MRDRSGWSWGLGFVQGVFLVLCFMVPSCIGDCTAARSKEKAEQAELVRRADRAEQALDGLLSRVEQLETEVQLMPYRRGPCPR